jgi:hypothetical protein
MVAPRGLDGCDIQLRCRRVVVWCVNGGGLDARTTTVLRHFRRTVRVSQQKFTLEEVIGSHACSLEANMRMTNGILLGCPLLLPVGTVICVQTLKDDVAEILAEIARTGDSVRCSLLNRISHSMSAVGIHVVVGVEARPYVGPNYFLLRRPLPYPSCHELHRNAESSGAS